MSDGFEFAGTFAVFILGGITQRTFHLSATKRVYILEHVFYECVFVCARRACQRRTTFVCVWEAYVLVIA